MGVLGFPLARIAAIFSLSCGAVLDLGFARYAGKGQGELSLLRRMWDIFQPGDVVLRHSLHSPTPSSTSMRYSALRSGQL